MTVANAGNSGAPPPLAAYHTRWQESADSPWQTGVDLALGFTWDGQEIPQPVVQMMGQDVSQYAAITVDENRCLVIAIDLGSVSSFVCSTTPAMYLGCSATLSADGQTFSGLISQLCNGPAKYNWEGQCDLPGATWLHAMNLWIEAATTSNSRTRSTNATRHVEPGQISAPAIRFPLAGESTTR